MQQPRIPDDRKAQVEPTMASALDVEAVRADFPILRQTLPKGLPLVFLDSAASAQKPNVVVEKEREVYQQYYANAYRGVYRFGARVDEELEACRAVLRRFIGASQPEEIIFTSGSTMSINIVAHGWAGKFLKPGDEVLLNEMEHHANLVPWQRAAAATGATCRFLPLTDDGRLDMAQLDRYLTDRTKLVAVTGMSNVLGTINPVGELARRAHERGALLLVDGAQSVPHHPTQVVDEGIDFLVFSGHKLFGPTGVGVLYARHELLAAMDPLLAGGHMIERVYRDHSTWAAPPAKFEAGTLPIAQAIALRSAVEYVEGRGFDAIEQHERDLMRYAWQRLREVPRLRIYGPAPEHRGPIFSFSVEGAHPEDLAQLLDRRGVFVRHGHHCTMPLHDRLDVPATVRASFVFYNTVSEVDALCDALEFARQKLRLT